MHVVVNADPTAPVAGFVGQLQERIPLNYGTRKRPCSDLRQSTIFNLHSTMLRERGWDRTIDPLLKRQMLYH